ncbi:MAG: tyrosine-type recombinase/integrase [Planctomycetota bacterium]|jgi:integrase
MPAKPVSVPRLRHHKATGQAAVVLKGRWVYLGRYGTAKAQERYDRVVVEWLNNGRRISPCGRTFTVAELILAYWKHAETYYRKHGEPTQELYGIKAAIRPLKRLYASLPVHGFSPLKLKAVRQAMVDTGHCRKYINDNVNRVKRMFRWAVENELAPPEVYHGLQAVVGLKRGRSEARETDPVQPVDDSLVEAIRPHVSRQVWAMVELQRLTGMRSGEVVAMRACDIDMNGKIWLYRPASHKTEHHGHDHVVELGPRAQVVIRPFLRGEVSVHLFCPRQAEAERLANRHRKRKTALSRGNRPGTNRKAKPKRKPAERYSRDSYRRAIDRAIRKAFPHPELSAIPESRLTNEQREQLEQWWKANHFHPHQLRHAFATKVRRLYGLEAAKTLLGHTSIDAAAIYAEADRQRAAEIVQQIG